MQGRYTVYEKRKISTIENRVVMGCTEENNFGSCGRRLTLVVLQCVGARTHTILDAFQNEGKLPKSLQAKELVRST